MSRARSRQVRFEFDPEPHREGLVALIHAIESLDRVDGAALDRVVRRHPRPDGLFSRGQIIAGFRHFAGRHRFACSEAEFVSRVQLRPVRTRSGVTPLTVLTRPFPCPGRCIFCPNDVRMPKSYLSDEPGAQRAAHNGFDPYLQTWSRLAAYRAIGHPTDKVELIVLGGTWSFHPEAYQRWFLKRCFDALNDFGGGKDGREAACADWATRGLAAPSRAALDGRSVRSGDYNRAVSQEESGARAEGASWSELARAQRENERSPCRGVGLSLETRPDHLSEREVVRLRRLGATKVQLGIQSLQDEVLAANARGHDVAATRAACRRLRAAGFKLQAHWMPNLLGSDPAEDVRDYARLFDDPDFRPDELKIYPCSLVESAELMRFWQSGTWRPYARDELLGVLTEALARTPRWCRLTRVIRDISSDDIVAGNKLTNFREIAERELAAQGRACRDVRSREIRGARFDERALALRATPYRAGVGDEIFLEFTTPDDRVVAFMRLALPQERSFVTELAGSALVRELHVYGESLELGAPHAGRAQHRGLGRRLVAEAARRARASGYATLSVISAVGTRPYYRRLGFADGGLYQHLALSRRFGRPRGAA